MALFSHSPNMRKMYDGRNVATRPIPVYHDISDMRAIAVAASDQQSRVSAVNMPSAPSVAGVEGVFGSKVAGAVSIKAGVFNPASGRDATL